MRKLMLLLLTILTSGFAMLYAQAPAAAPVESNTTLRISSRAVLIDVLVTDSKGNPVSGLPKDAFTVTEQGKPQSIEFFEEHRASDAAPVGEMPKLPPNTFSNYSPFPEPPAVTLLLLDSLNTRMESQSFVHKQALKFLESAKPGQRMAIFTMGLGLHFVQGFNDDPTVLLAALKDKKNNWVESSVALKSTSESTAQANVVGMMSAPAPAGAGAPAGVTPPTISIASAGGITALQNFFSETDFARDIDRMQVTLTNLQKLATFLEGFPGRKNIIWFAESAPSFYVSSSNAGTGIHGEIDRTLAMLAAARAALYPVDARGLSNSNLYAAENNLPKGLTTGSQLNGVNGSFAESRVEETKQRNMEQASEELMAEESGGKAFANTNGLARITGEISSQSGDFYSISYKPTNSRMDGTYRKIEVKVAGNNLKLSYRRGYFARDDALPGSSLVTRNREVQRLAAKDPSAVNPLLPFMDLGMPQSQQIVYKAKVNEDDSPTDKDKKLYTVDFNIDTKSLDLPLDADGLHTGMLNISILAYDRYGNVVGRKEHIVALNIKPDVWKVFEEKGVQLHAEIEVPKGNYWLRTGLYDQYARAVGTLEIPLAAVKPDEDAEEQ